MKSILIIILITVLLCSGCTVTFTANDALQVNLSKPADKTVSLISEFESGEEAGVAGDATQKSGSVCVSGACIVY